MKRNHRIWRFLYKLHRYIGLISAIVLLMLATTGIALNHTEDLKLDSKMVKSNAILDWYGIKPELTINSFATKKHWLSVADQQLYFDHNKLLTNQHMLLGAVETNDFIVAAFKNSLILLSLEGEIIEQLSLNKIEKIGLSIQQQIVLKSSKGVISSQDGLITWQPYQDQQIQWSKESPTPETIKQNIQNNFRISILPWERVLLDIHSGRFFGTMGVVIVDITGVFLMILAISGCAIWLKHKLRSFHFFPKP